MVVVAPDLGVHKRRALGEGGVDVGHERQVLPRGVHGLRPPLCCITGLRHDERDGICLPARDVGRHRRPTGGVDTDHHGLIEHGEPVLVDRDIGRGEHRHHPRGRFGLGVELVGMTDVARVQGRTGHLVDGVEAGSARADAHGRLPRLRIADTMVSYPVQRQRLPDRACLIRVSSAGVSSSSRQVAATTKPGVQ